MLTKEDKDEIKRLIVETVAGSPSSARQTIEINESKLNVADITARAIEVFGNREKALRWLRTPVRSLDDQTPLSLLDTSEGVGRVQDTLGRIEHGVW